ncbi:MAG: amidase [Alphaproteobacteria bacterium]
MTDPTAWTLVEAADALDAGRISSRELTEACLARVARLQPVLNCFIHVDADEALAEADAADVRRARGEPLGPLHGVPLAHKDMYYSAGRLSTCGSKIRRDFRPEESGTVMERLAVAGAVDLGGLNMSEFAVGPTGHNVHWGHCRNPWNPAHVTGGSSSGSGSAVGGRLAFGALGSDTGGSIRLPAGLCGLVGIKATQTRVSRHGVMGLSFSLDCVGPLTRTVRDCARMLGVVAGFDPKDPTSSREPVDDYEAAACRPAAKGLRIGVPTSYFYDGAAPEVRALMEASLAVYRDLGAEIVEVDIPDPAPMADLAAATMGPESGTLHHAWLRGRPQDYAPQVRARLEPGLAIPGTWYLRAQQLRPQMVRQFVDGVFARCDVLHAPTLNVPVPTIAETDLGDTPGFTQMVARMTHCTRPFNYLTLPAIAVPAGFTANGLPASFQLIGRPFAEARLFSVAAAYEAATDWTRRPPPLD